jgi:SNF2 family DNA or RNA helicase
MSRKTYGSMRWDPRWKRWSIDRLEPHVAIRLKATFPRIAITRTAPFVFDNRTEVAADLVWFTQRYPLEIKGKDLELLLQRAEAHRTHVEAIEKCFQPRYKPPVFKLKGELRPYQAQAVDVLLRGNHLLCGDDVGLGKTLVAIGAMTRKECLPAVVVVQTHLPQQWAEQVEKFLDARVHMIMGTKPYDLPEADIYITKYSCIAGWADFFADREFGLVVFDEVQELRRAGSQKYLAAQVLTARSKRVLGLSATPIYNYGEDIFNIMDLIKPGSLGTRDDFMREWTTTNGRVIKDPQALGSYLRESHLFIRRTRSEVGRELPPVNRIVHTVGFDELAVKKVEDVARILAQRVIEGSFVERGQAARELDLRMRMTTGVSKATYVAEYVRMLLENGEPVLLAGWHRDCYDIWNRELLKFKPVMYTGTESGAQKEAAKRAFVSGESNLMMISLRSGVGLDGLQERGSIVVFGELDWSPAVHEQLIGRLQRDGQAGQVTAIYLVSEAGSDPLMVNLLGLKASQATSIIDPLSGPPETMSDDSRIRMLAQQLLDSRPA